MNILATAQENAREDFFLHFLAEHLAGKGAVQSEGVTYAEGQTFYAFQTPAGPLQVRVFENADAESLSIHLRATLHALLPGEDRIPTPDKKKKAKWRFADFTKPLMSEFFPAVFLIDCTMADFKHPFLIQHRPDGVNLWSALQERYFFRAGQTLARVHKTASFNATGKPGLLGRFKGALAAAEDILPSSMRKRITALDRDSKTQTYTLVNNRYFGPNVWIDVCDRVRAVDWSAAIMDNPLADLLPMKYWTTIAARTDTLQHDPDAWQSFINGYGAAATKALFDAPFARAMEAVWLMEQLSAETARRNAGDLRPPYPEPDDYLAHLDKLLAG